MRKAHENLPPGLVAILEAMPKIAIAYSGGLDSRFLAHAAMLCGCDVLLLHGQGSHISHSEEEFATQWAQEQGLSLIALSHDPLLIPEAAANSRRRCYFCKKSLFGQLVAHARTSGYEHICDGGNLDDRNAYRPGMAAVAECGVLSPLAEAGMDKQAIRAVGRATGLASWNQPSSACLLTRFAYGLVPDYDSLRAIDECEQNLHKLLVARGHDGQSLRLRLCPEPVLQITPDVEVMRDELRNLAERHGFAGARVCVCESLSGFFDNAGGQ